MANLNLPLKIDIERAIAPPDYRNAASGRRYLPDQVVRVFFMPSQNTNGTQFKPYSASQVSGYAQTGTDVAQINANFQSIRTEDRARLMANVFGAWQRYARISFVEVTDMAQADIRVGAAQFNGTAANIPSVRYGDRFGSDVYVNLGLYYPSAIDSNSIVDHFSPGRRETHDLMHEVGHAIGIQHPALGQDGGTLEARFNHMPFTVMTNFSPLTDGFGPTAPSIMDMVGLEAIYGLRTAINEGNTIHRLDSPRGAAGRVGGDRTGKVIYDTGPGIDTLAAEYLHASGEIEVSARPAVIDLRPAHFSSIDMNNVNLYNISIWYDTIIENAIGGSADDVITGNDGINILEGNGGSDWLFGGAGADELYGERKGSTAPNGAAGSDVLDGGGADNAVDILVGGDGPDAYLIYVGGGRDIIKDKDKPNEKNVIIGFDANGVPFAPFNNIFELKDVRKGVTAYVSPDGRITLKHDSPYTLTDSVSLLSVQFGETVSDFQSGDFGITLHDAPTVIGKTNTAANTNNNDSQAGTPGFNDRMQGLNGRDSLSGGDGDDWIEGGADGTYTVGATNYVGGDILVGGLGNDVLIGNIAFGDGTAAPTIDGIAARIAQTSASSSSTLVLGDLLSGGPGDDILVAGANNNLLMGGSGSDLLIGGIGDDYLFGGVDASGSQFTWKPTVNADGSLLLDFVGGFEETADIGDAIYASAGNDRAYGGAGDDYLDMGQGNDFGVGGAGNDVLLGGDGADQLNGDSSEPGVTQGIDFLSGGAGNDTLSGGGMDDYLVGGTGDDWLKGGAGRDTYLYSRGDGQDLIDDAATTPADASIVILGAGIDAVVSLTLSTAPTTVGQLVLRFAGSRAQGSSLGDPPTINTLTVGTLDYVAPLNQPLLAELRFADGRALRWEDLLAQGLEFVGTSGNDTQLQGLNIAAGGDRIYGLDGNDSIRGYAGDDSLNGGAGNDTLDGGAGIDTLVGGAGDDTYLVDNAGDTITDITAGGTDTVLSNVTRTLETYVEHLELTGSATINGTGNDLPNRITGNSADNVLNGGTDNDTLIGGAGNDLYYVSTDDSVTEVAGQGWDHVVTDQSRIIDPEVEGLTINGNGAQATGDGRDNYLAGADDAAANTLIGLGGNDRYVIGANDIVTEALNSGTDTVEVVTGASYTLAANVENLVLTGTAVINGTGNDLANQITGNSADNVLNGGAGNDLYYVSTGDSVTELAGQGWDHVVTDQSRIIDPEVEGLTINGNGASATGDGRDNYLAGADDAAANTLIGLGGNDRYVIGANDIVTEALDSGTDTVEVVTGASYTLAANVENLVLTGTAVINGTGNDLSNQITGNSADNVLNGGAGNDTLIGGAGNDLYYVSAGDSVTELAGQGWDHVVTDQSRVIDPEVEGLTINGNGASATGDGRDNYLSGANDAAANTLIGLGGNDSYYGGRGGGADKIVENDGIQGNIDTAVFLPGVSSSQVWFRKASNNLDLEASILGTTDMFLVQNWYLGNNYRVEQFKTTDGNKTLSTTQSAFADLVQAMAGITPGAGATSLAGVAMSQNQRDTLNLALNAVPSWQ